MINGLQFGSIVQMPGFTKKNTMKNFVTVVPRKGSEEHVLHHYRNRLKPFRKRVQVLRAQFVDRSKYKAADIRKATALRGISPKKLKAPVE